MSSLSSSSTLDEIVASYADSASYAEDASAAKCRAFLTACRLLLVKRPSRVRHGGGEEIELDLALVANQLTEANRWLVANGGSEYGGGYIHPDMTDFRG